MPEITISATPNMVEELQPMEPMYNLVVYDSNEVAYEYVLVIFGQIFHFPMNVSISLIDKIQQHGKYSIMVVSESEADEYINLVNECNQETDQPLRVEKEKA